MRKYETKRIPATTREVLVEIECDLCGNTTTQDWRDEMYEATESTVSLRTGAIFPGGGSGELTTIDICPDCFKEKLIPWVRSLGGEPSVEEWDT
jgi:hypothetical protein